MVIWNPFSGFDECVYWRRRDHGVKDAIALSSI